MMMIVVGSAWALGVGLGLILGAAAKMGDRALEEGALIFEEQAEVIEGPWES